QRKFRYVEKWTGSNLMESNPRKCKVMVIGGSHENEPLFELFGTVIPFTDSYKYVGVQIQSKGKNIFRLHYENKAQAARVAAMAAFSLNSIVGPIDPLTGRKLYLAQIDPHLTAACDVCVDTEQSHLRMLERVQETFIRRFLGLSDKSLTAFLFSETGLWPIAYRRLTLAVRYLGYIIDLPDAHLAKRATKESDLLARQNCARGWYAGLIRLLKDRANFALPAFGSLSPQIITDALSSIRKTMLRTLRQRLDNSPKAYLVRDTQVEDEHGRVSKPVIYLRHYLTIIRRSHRLALTKLLLSDHSLASERMRWLEKDKRPPRNLRLCRNCGNSAETPEHIMFSCKLPQNTGAGKLRSAILTMLGKKGASQIPDSEATTAVRSALRSQHTVATLAELAYTSYTYFNKLQDDIE
ncbi:hypothetical protein M407DRAFT_84758, partial [Tulasnella calospora MUT 4182]